MKIIKSKMTNNSKCEFCDRTIRNIESYPIFKINVKTNKKTRTFGVVYFIESLNEYCFKKMYHLSGSQIFFFRQDIVREYLQEKLKEIVLDVEIKSDKSCKKCFNNAIKLIPLM